MASPIVETEVVVVGGSLLGPLRPTVEVMRLIRKTFEAIRRLEKELGEPVGFREVGSLRVAATEARERELDELLALGRAEGIAVERIDRAMARRLVPAVSFDAARAIGLIHGDGFIDPYQLAPAYAPAARRRGVTIWTGTSVTDIDVRDGRVRGVTTDRGEIGCRAVVDAAGAWANSVESPAGVALPQSPVRSHFWITAPRPDVLPDQPDATYLVGPIPGVEGFIVASGCSGLGVTGSGGVGHALSELLTAGESSLDLRPLRPDRFGRVDPDTPEFRRTCALARSGTSAHHPGSTSSEDHP